MRNALAALKSLFGMSVPESHAEQNSTVAVIVSSEPSQFLASETNMYAPLNDAYAGHVHEAVTTLSAYLGEHHERYTAHGMSDVYVLAPTQDMFVLDGQHSAEEMLAFLDMYADEAQTCPTFVAADLFWPQTDTVFDTVAMMRGYSAERRAVLHAVPAHFIVVLAGISWHATTPNVRGTRR